MSTNKRTVYDIVEGKDLSEQVFLVTGGYKGLGAESVKAFLKAGARVIIVGRNEESQNQFASNLLNHSTLKISKDQIDAEQTMDLASLESVRRFAKQINKKYNQIDVLMNNAGIMRTPPGKTEDGFEIQMGTNVIGHFLLAKILAPKTKRQVWVSSSGHMLVNEFPGEHCIEKAPRINIEDIAKVDEHSYHSWRRYQQSKLGDILLSKQFIKEFPGLYSYSVHPGVNRTNLGKHISFWNKVKIIPKLITGKVKLLKPANGASTQVYCAVAPINELENGAYYADCHVEPSSEASYNSGDVKKLYDYCDEVTKPYQN